MTRTQRRWLLLAAAFALAVTCTAHGEGGVASPSVLDIRPNPKAKWDAGLRDVEKNRVVAGVLLPMFEQKPGHWEAVTWLNAAAPNKPRSFQRYLTDWRHHCPPGHKGFVVRVAGKFGVALPTE